MVLSFKNKIIFTNAAILVIFVALLDYSAIKIVQVTSQNEFLNIKESIITHNKKLLLTLVKSQSVSLDKEVEIITEELNHVTFNFSHYFYHEFFKESKKEKVLNEKLIYINKNLKPFIAKVIYIDNDTHKSISAYKNKIVSQSAFVDLGSMIRYKNFYIEKKVTDKDVKKFSIYVRPVNWGNSLLKFEIDLGYFSRSLSFENIVDEFQYRYFLVDDKGKLVASNLQENVNKIMSNSVFIKEASITAREEIMSNDLGSFLVDDESGIFNVTFFKNDHTGWRLILVTPEHIIHSNYSTIKELVLSADDSFVNFLFLTYIVILRLFLAINSIVVNKMLMPISELTVQAKHLKSRDFNKATHTVHSNGDEIEQLSRAYSEAGTQIQSLIEGLEQEVEERTKQYELAAKEASEANKQKSVLLSNVSHEVRTPLNAILGYTHMLEHTKQFDDYSHELNGISSASNTILGIVNDLLDFERIRTTSYSLEPKSISVIALLNDIENTFLPLSESKQLSLDIVCNVDRSTTLMVDELRLKQAISNIVANALKFTSQGGVTLEVSTDDNAFNVLVSDTGVGIPQDKLESVFNGFEQVNQQDQQFGFGLGLAITKTIVELMNGTLSVESEVGLGSTFLISLPAEDIMNISECSNSAPKREENCKQSVDYKNKKALIVDDVEFNREILEFHLNTLGFECKGANDGAEGLELASEHEFDVVLTDISMPIMDGIELASELKKLKPLLPVIAVTARATLQEECQMNQYFSCYLTKPLNPSDLKLKLHCALTGESC